MSASDPRSAEAGRPRRAARALTLGAMFGTALFMLVVFIAGPIASLGAPDVFGIAVISSVVGFGITVTELRRGEGAHR